MARRTGRRPERRTPPRFSPEEVERRRALLPQPRYAADLPITERRDEILATLADHQVVVVAGETGSGKSTQLPKLCLELGRGAAGLIGHTQPRRIAARSIAERVAEELDTTVGGLVGYAVRFTDEVGRDTLVKLMTDGILLAEIQRDPDLGRYDTLIIDEAHERSLNIDFLLGYLTRLLPRRPDLKVIITSATIDTARFAAHFDAPIVEVSGRTYPVEMRYRPLEDPDAADPETGRVPVKDQVQGIVDAVEELRREGPGDVLVFCSGERDIRDAADALREARWPDTEILPLYARLSAAEQHRVFSPHRGRRIVLATNVAETSLTVPGIRYVVDPGEARISRYNHRTKVQRLPIEPVSQASADQRAGRCGRIGPGVCIRLYSEEDLDARPRFTEPEIQRTNLASVILQMAALGLGSVEDFPFVDPPDTRAVRDGIGVLVELGALDPDSAIPRLTPLGRQLARIPLDPRLGRMVLDGHRLGCLHEVMVIAAALSIIDPRERPTGEEQQADALHARFRHPDSDFLSYIALWEHVRELRSERSSSAWRRQLRAEHLHVMRTREWQDLYAQIRRIATQMGMKTRHDGKPADADTIHRALLGGLLSNVGMKVEDTREYRGARNARFTIAAGSNLSRSGPRWIVAAELVETNRMWARTVARIRPEWIEEVGAHLVARSYGEPRWDVERGAALTIERVTLFGLPVVAGRTMNLTRVDPELARELFVLHALVRGEWHARHDFVATNADTIEQVHDLEARARRDLLTTEDVLADWFEERIPDHVTSVRAFDKWWKDVRRDDPHRLDVPVDVLTGGDDELDADAFPDSWNTDRGATLPVAYEFDPQSPTDGVSVEVPLGALRQLDSAPFEWNVPGVRADLVDALVRSLPKALRRPLVPVPETVAAVLPSLDPRNGRGLLAALADALSGRAGARVRPGDFDLDKVPDHLRPTFVVVDDDGAAIAHGKSLDALAELLDGRIRAAVADAGSAFERSGLADWPGGDIPRRVETGPSAHPIAAYPALVDEGSTVALRLLPDPDEQWEAMWAGTRRLLTLGSAAAPVRAAARMITNRTALALAVSPWRSGEDWAADLVGAALDHVIDAAGGPSWTEAGFEALAAAARAEVPRLLADAAPAALDVVTSLGRIVPRLSSMDQPTLAPTVGDVRRQVDALVHPGVLTAAGVGRIGHLRRYLLAVEHRLDKAPEDLRRDHERMLLVLGLERELDEAAAAGADPVGVDEVEWTLQELRVASFAQHLGTDGPVSEKRIRTALARLRG